jgi:hypothetical protein
MKNYPLQFSIALLICFFALSCNNSSNDSETEAVATDSIMPAQTDAPAVAPAASSSQESTQSGKSDCDKFLEEYESYSMEYIEIVKKYAADPSNTSLMNEITSYAQTSQKWGERWKDLGQDCATDPGFSQKYLDVYTSELSIYKYYIFISLKIFY